MEIKTTIKGLSGTSFDLRTSVDKKLACQLNGNLRDYGHGMYLYLYNMHTDEAFRRQGHATRLLKGMLALARRLGIKTVRLDTNADNHNAIKLYEKIGFEHCKPTDTLAARWPGSIIEMVVHLS